MKTLKFVIFESFQKSIIFILFFPLKILKPFPTSRCRPSRDYLLANLLLNQPGCPSRVTCLVIWCCRFMLTLIILYVDVRANEGEGGGVDEGEEDGAWLLEYSDVEGVRRRMRNLEEENASLLQINQALRTQLDEER